VRRRSWWGWGWEDQALSPEQAGNLAAALATRPGFEGVSPAPAPRLEDVELPAPRLAPPDALAPFCSTDPHDRASHTYGKAYRDTVRAFAGDLSPAPSFVAFPRTERDVVDVLDWCASTTTPVVPFGGGSSVCGGTELAGAVSLDLSHLDQLLEVDTTSRAARLQAGMFGPALEDALRPHGYTLRHFPQSFEFSTLGGWLATRSGGHYATNYTHIDDFVESMRVVTPAGVVESRRLPGSGAGPSPDRMFLGSEGILGVITEAWMRVQDRPTFRASAGVRFNTFAEGVAAARAVSQAALFPANCRLLDPGEAMTSAGVTDGSALLVLGFESADHPVDAWIARAVELVQDHGGQLPEGVRSSSGAGPSAEETRDSAAGAWRSSFLRAPYGRDAMVSMNLIADTFETACPWSAFDALHAGVTEAVEKVLAEVCGGGWMTCRFTHVYPDGPAPYFTFLAPGRKGALLEQWDAIKTAASDAVLAHGGTKIGRAHV